MKIKIRISGVTPLICNRFTEEAAMAATSGTRSSAAGRDRGTVQEIAESKLYKDVDGSLCVPTNNVLRCIVEGGRFHKVGKKQLTTQKSSVMFSCLYIEGSMARIEHKEKWVVFEIPVRIPSTGGRINSYRPQFHDWALTFTAVLDESIIGQKLFRCVVDDAGKRIGLGDFRPDTKGPFGKFVVDLWEPNQA